MEAEDVPQDEDGDLARRQHLQGGHEGQGDGLGPLVAGLRAGRIGRAFHEGIGKRLKPGDLAEACRRGRLVCRDVPLRGGPPAGRAQGVEAPVGGDLVQPGADRGASLEPAEPLPGGQQRVLDSVLGVLERSEHSVAVDLQLPAVMLGQFLEGLAVPGLRPRDQVGCQHLHAPRHLPLMPVGTSIVIPTPAGT